MDINIIGTGCTPAPGSVHLNKGFKELLVDASYQAIKNADINIDSIDGAVFSYTGEGEINHGGVGPTMVNTLGLRPIPAFINCANCASGHAAFLQGCDMIASGNYDNVLVAGVGKNTDLMAFENYMLLSSESQFDFKLGYSHIDSFLLASEYFANNNINSSQAKKSLLKVALQSREFASINPNSHLYKKKISQYQFENMPFFGCTMSTGEGAAAIILSNSSMLKKKQVKVKGRSFITTSHYVGSLYDTDKINKEFFEKFKNPKGNMSTGLPLKLACENAYKSANICPTDIDTLQVYDQGVNQFISLEASGICSQGEAVDYYLSGKTELNGLCPVNTDGGNIGRGFASGSSGLYSIIELVNQINEEAGERQINKKVKNALSTYIGGYYADSIAIVLGK